MKWNVNLFLYGFLLFSIVHASCTRQTQHTKEEIVQALNNYDLLILQQDPAAIAKAFTPDGKLGDAATGREAIQTLLSQVNSFKVIEQSTTSTDVEIRGDSALQKGNYIQRNVSVNNDTAKVVGTFVCKWRWSEGEGWKIAHIITKPF